MHRVLLAHGAAAFNPSKNLPIFFVNVLLALIPQVFG
jgi:hypothetical protein